MKRGKQGTVKNLIVTALMIGAVATGFFATTQLAVAAENNRVVTLPTTYPAVVTPLAAKTQPDEPDEYVKPTYTLVDNDLEYYRDMKPTANDISREKAAEIGVKGLTSVFDIDLNGQEIEMTYDKAERGLRATWSGNWWYNGPKKPDDTYVATYWFRVDAVSGELLDVAHDRVLPSDVKPGFDGGLQNGSKEYNTLAEKAALKYGAIRDAVKTAEYGGQGSNNNDPIIWYELTGSDGERARITFSRHDSAVVGVTFNAGMQALDEAGRVMNQEAAEIQRRAEEYFAANPDATTYTEDELDGTVVVMG